MSEGFAVDPERLAARADELAGVAERAAGVAAELDRVLAESGRPWGGDAVGQSFAAAHERPAADALERLRGLAGGLGEVGGKLAGAAGAYRAGDETAADDVTAAGDPGGERGH